MMSLEDRIKEVEDLMVQVDNLEPVADEMRDKKAAEELKKASRDAWYVLYHYKQELKKEYMKEIA